MNRDETDIFVSAQVDRLLTHTGAPKDRESHRTELLTALRMFQAADVETAVTMIVRSWTERAHPRVGVVVTACREARKARLSALPPEEQPRGPDLAAVCRCGARPRLAYLLQTDRESKEAVRVERFLAPCNERWHTSRGQPGRVVLPPNFDGWVED